MTLYCYAPAQPVCHGRILITTSRLSSSTTPRTRERWPRSNSVSAIPLRNDDWHHFIRASVVSTIRPCRAPTTSRTLAGATAQCDRSDEHGDRVASCFCGEDIGEVTVGRAAPQAAGLVDREQPFDRLLAAVRAAAEGELAVDDGGAQSALGRVVGQRGR